MKKAVSFFLFWVLLGNSALLLAQPEPELVVPETDKFQDYFFEAIKQKGIENYDLALVELERCLKLKPNEAVVFSEMGKNYFGLKNYEQSYSSYEKAAQIDPKNKWYWAGMYEVGYQTNNYNKAIIAVNKLIEFSELYKDDLVELYMNTQQFDKALVLINELNDKVGKSKRRESYKTQILAQGKFQNAEINNLSIQIKLNPKEESNYVALIKLYSENNQNEKATEIFAKLETEIPNSDWARVGLFKSYLNKNEIPKAINTLNLILESAQIESKIKHRVLSDFLNFVNKNPQYTPDLDQAVAYLDKDPDVNLAKEIGLFYHKKKQWDKAIQFYELSLKNNLTPDAETNMLLLQTYVETKQFDLVAKKATVLVEAYPTQPQFYYYSGLANNQTKEFKKAVTLLEMGLDYVIDDIKLETNFNLQLGEAYNGLGDFAKKEKYFAKANQLLKAKK